MHRIWLERALPAEHAHLLEGIATLLGPGTATPENPLVSIDTADAVIAASRVRYNAELFQRAPNLRVVCRTGIGYDNISLSDATAHGVAACNVPDGPSISTAEHAIALLMAVTKNIVPAFEALRRPARTDFFTQFNGLELAGLQIGIIGLGRIGRRVAAIAAGIGMRVIGFDPFVDRHSIREPIELADSIEALLSTSDAVSLHLPLTKETRHLIDRDRLAKLKPGAVLINTARGGLVDESALLEALNCGHLWGAGLDVFDPEPPPYDHPLLAHPRVVATPHIAAATVASKQRVWQGAIRQAIQVLQGHRPPHLLNPEVWPRPIQSRVKSSRT